MDEPPSTTAHRSKRQRATSAPLATPSPSRRRLRRLTGSSPGCVPRPLLAHATATTPVMALRTPPRRLLPPSGAGNNSSASARTTRPRRATPILRLDGDEEDADAKEPEKEEQEESEDRDADVDGGASTGDDAFSIISGDGSPERDRHVLEFLSFNSLADGTPAFSLLTPSPAVQSTPVTRHIKAELIGGAFTPQSSPLRSRSSASSSRNASPSRFFRSPYVKSRSNSTVSSPVSLRLSGDEDEESKQQETQSFRQSGPQSLAVSPRTPPHRGDDAVKNEPLQEVISVVCRPPRGSPSTASSPSSSASNSEWRRNSLSLMRTPSPAASAKAKALRSKALAAQLVRSTTRDPFGSSDEEMDKDELSGAPSGAHDQDWFFSFANTLSPLAPGGAHDDDLETSFLSLKCSPGILLSSYSDVQRLVPPFPSPGLGPSYPAPAASAATPKTPLFMAAVRSGSAGSSASSSTAPSSASSGCSIGSSSTASSSASRELTESFPNIRASTSATPGRDERLKVSSSSVMKMKLHVTFDQFPPSHTKREMDAINDSLKRKTHARKRKLEESKQLRQGKTNGKGLNVQRKLLQTPVKDDETTTSKPDAVGEVKERPLKNRKALQGLNGRATQRRILTTLEELGEVPRDNDGDSVASVASSGSGSSSVASSSSTDCKPLKAKPTIDVGSTNASVKESAASSLRRRLSPTFNGVSTPTLPSRLVGTTTTPNLHPLRLRKSPMAAKPSVTKSKEKPAGVPDTQPAKESKAKETAKPVVAATPVASMIKPAPQPPQPPQPPASSALLSTSATPVKTPAATRQVTTGTTPLAGTKGGFVATPQLLATPVQKAGMTTPAPGVAQGDVAVPKKKSPCNCKKSKCLKLYCECFASGGYCDESCNCVGCANTPANEPVRQQAIASRLEKNPNAFKPKIETTTLAAAASTMTPGTATTATAAGGFGFTTPHGHPHHHHHHHSHPTSAQGHSGGDMKKMHKHGCHCKKSACQKRYCECFQAGVPCGDNCRCIDCKNQSPYVSKNVTMATPLSAIGMRGPGTKELTMAMAATGANPERGEEQFVSPTFSSIRQRLRIDRETWARNFSSPFEVSPRRERERTERFRTQLKNSRASALLRSFNATSSAPVPPPGGAVTPTTVVIKTEPGISVAATSALSFRVNTASFMSPPGATHSATQGGLCPRGLSPLGDATRPPPAPNPIGKGASSGRMMKTTLPRNTHAMEALAIGRQTPGRVYVLPLFGQELPPVKSEVSAAIFHFLTNADIYNASLVSRLWSRVTMGETVWDHSNFRRAPRVLEIVEEADGDVVMQT